MRVVWIGGARNVEGIGVPVGGQVYDWPDHVAASLIEQGHAELAKPEPAPTSDFGVNPFGSAGGTSRLGGI